MKYSFLSGPNLQAAGHVVIARRQPGDDIDRIGQRPLARVVGKAHDLAVQITIGTFRIGDGRVRPFAFVDVGISDIDVVVAGALSNSGCRAIPSNPS